MRLQKIMNNMHQVEDAKGNMLYFSYETLIGFRAVKADNKTFVIQNQWRQTTGKHLNYLDNGDKKTRLSPEKFEEYKQLLRA